MKKTFCDRCKAQLKDDGKDVRTEHSNNRRYSTPNGDFVYVGSDGNDYCRACVADIVLGKEYIAPAPPLTVEALMNR